MKVAESMGIRLEQEMSLCPQSARAKMAEFSSSSIKPADGSSNQGKKNFVSELVSGLVALPGKVLSAAWSIVKYSIYFATCGILCKPGYSASSLADALQKVLDSDDRAASWAQFKQDFPRGLDQLLDLSVAKQRDTELGQEGSKDRSKVAEWNETYLEEYREDYKECFETQQEKTLKNAIFHLKGQAKG